MTIGHTLDLYELQIHTKIISPVKSCSYSRKIVKGVQKSQSFQIGIQMNRNFKC